VRGERDPLRSEHFQLALLPSPALSPTGHELTDFLQQNGLHPYRLPQACEFVPGCLGCQGYLCAKACKNDSARICLEPSLTQYGAALLDGCEVVRLEANREAVTKVVCVRDGIALTLEAEVVVLAAGALGTPKILLNSDSPEWPRGLANDSGLVGRHLMRHHIDLYAIFPVTRQPFASGNPKEIAFNDFYGSGGEKFGTVQSFGFLPPASMLLAGAEEDLRGGGMRWAAVPVNLLRPMLEPALRWMFSGAVVLAAIMEDLPYLGNRVTLERRAAGRATISFNYHINDGDQVRLKAFRRKIATLLKPYRMMRIEQAANNQRIAHACGTCRFGLHPNDSVLDGNNKAHGFSNLYVVDASFFPSSGGTNPALTIAANALRVGEHLVRGFSRRTPGFGKRPSN
jgi:choline dehydrogenase-like flavoprotein